MSTVIAEREEANVVHTQDDTTIVFRGFVDTSRSSQSGVPLEVFNKLTSKWIQIENPNPIDGYKI